MKRCLGCGREGPTEFCSDCTAEFEAEERAYHAHPAPIADVVDDVMDRLRQRAQHTEEGPCPEAA